MKAIYKVSSGDLIDAVEAKTPELAIKKFINKYALPSDGWQRVQIDVQFISMILLK
jgi:hypothetical protein